MNKKLTLILILLTNSMIGICQFNITGIVIGKEDDLEIPGVIVIEKGTVNGTVTDINGQFSLKVSNPNSILVFSFVGMVEKAFKLKGQNDIVVIMKADCMMDSFDHQYIGFLANSGLVNTPIGGQFEFSFPAFFRSTTLKTAISYQTNLKENEFLNSEVEFDHVIFECDYQMDLKWYYRQVSFDNDFNSTAYSLETNLIFSDLNFSNVYNVGLIAGYSELTFQNIGINNRKVLSGSVIGIVADLGKPFYSNVYGKVSVYKNMLEYQSKIRFDYRKIAAFIKFYKLESYTELSIGIGLNTCYWLKKQRR